MFSNLKKKIESEVGDLSRLTPSSVLNRTSNSSTLSSRHASVSSLASEPAPQLHHDTNHMTTPTSSRSSSVQQQQQQTSLNQIKIKQLEEKLQTQESDFAWRLSTKDDEILKLGKTVDILTAELRDKENEVKRKLCRVQEDIDEIEGFSQQENAKLKHLLLNKEEEMGRLRGEVLLKGEEIERLNGRLKELESENERVTRGFEKLRGSSSGGNDSKIQELESTIENLKRELDVTKNKQSEKEKVVLSMEKREQEFKVLLEQLEKDKRDKDNQVQNLSSKLDQLHAELESLSQVNSSVQEMKVKIKQQEDMIAEFQNVSGQNENKLEELASKSKEYKLWGEGLDHQNGDLRHKLNETEEKVKTLSKQIGELEGENERVTRDFEKFKRSSSAGNDSTIQELESTIGNMRRELDVTKNKQSEKEKVILGMEKREQELKVLVEQLEEDKRANDSKLQELGSTIENLKRELDVTKNQQLEKEKVVLSMEKREQELKVLVEQLEKDKSDKDNQVQNLSSKLDQLQAELELKSEKESLFLSTSDELSKLTSDLTISQQTSKDLRVQVEKLRSEVDEARKEVRKVEMDRDDLSDTISVLEVNVGKYQENIEKLTRSNEELNRMLELAEQEKLELSQKIGLHESELESLSQVHSSVEEMKVKIKQQEDMIAEFQNVAGQNETKLEELASRSKEYKLWGEALDHQNGDLRHKLDEMEEKVKTLSKQIGELEGEKEELLLNISEMQERVDELDEECRFLKEGKERVKELEGIVSDKEKQLRQQSQALSDLRRSLAKELSSKDKQEPQAPEELPIQQPHSNGTLGSNNTGAAMLPQYETDVNFMYLRSVLFKYLTSQDPQITTHLTRVVATLLHLTEEETTALIASTESRNSHLLSLIK